VSTRTTTLALEVVSEVTDATSGLDRVESAAEGVAAAMAKLEDANDRAGRSLDGVTDKADTLDAAGAGLTGALGALSSGFELIGAEKAAEALNNAGLATDFLSGVGQAAALAVQGQAAATQALTTAQKAANVAMRANPIGLVVVAVVALVAILGVAYAKSETFRNIVQDAGRKGKAAMDAVVEGVKAVVSWVADRIPGAFAWFKDKAAAVVRPATTVVETVRDAAKDVWEWVGKVPAKFGEMKDKAQEIAGPLLSPFTAVKDAVQWIIDKVANLKVPDWFSKLPGMNGRTNSGPDYTLDAPTVPFPGAPAAPTVPTVAITVQGALDPYAVAVQIRDLLARYNLAVS
jgi:phage-related protein